MHAPAAAKPTPAMILLLAAMTAFGALSIDTYLPAMPAIGADLGASAVSVQRTLSALLAGLAVGQIVYGPLSDRIGRRPPILFGVALFIAASAGCALAQSVEQLTFARFVQGLGACASLVVSRAVVRDRYDHSETARILSLIFLIFGIVPILAPLLGGYLLLWGGWRSIFWVLAGFGVAVLVAVGLGLKESRSAATAKAAAGESVWASYRLLLRQRRLVGYILAGACNGACLFTYIAASPDLVIGTYGIAPHLFGWVFGINAAGLIVGSQVNRRLLLTHSSDRILAVATLVMLALGLVMVAAAATGIGGMWGVLGPLFFVLATYGFVASNSTAGALSVDPLRTGATSGLSGTLSFAVGALATAAVGIVHDGTALPMAAMMATALAGSAAFLFFLALPRGRGTA